MIKFISGQVMHYYMSHDGRPVCMYRLRGGSSGSMMAPESNVAQIIDILNYGLNHFFEMGDLTGMQLPYVEDEDKPRQFYVFAPWP